MPLGYSLIDRARCGLENMALDQAMLEQTARDAIVRVRFYQWSEPTVSLGYFQPYADFETFIRSNILRTEAPSGPALGSGPALSHANVVDFERADLDKRLNPRGSDSPSACLTDQSLGEIAVEPSRALSVVRRATGGGAIIHHFDWTYSIAMPAEVLARTSLGAIPNLYENVHRAVVEWINQTGMSARTWDCHETPASPSSSMQADAAGQPASCHRDFLCFNRRHTGDVVMGAAKVLGSAQRRYQTAVLQHGSLLLAASPLAPKLQGLRDLAGSEMFTEMSDFSAVILRQLSQSYELELATSEFGLPGVQVSDELRNRLASWQWLARI